MDTFESLSEQELDLVQKLKDAVGPTVQKHPELQVFCNDWTYVRFLRASPAHAVIHLLQELGLPKGSQNAGGHTAVAPGDAPQEIMWHQVEKEAETGKTFVSAYPDREGRPVVVMRPRNQNTKDEQQQVQFLIYCLEHASRLADEQRVGKMTWLLDFEGYSMRNAPAVRTSLAVLHTLQNHYPERLGSAVCFHAPGLFSLTWKAVSPFIDPVTKKKIAFIDKGPKQNAEMSERFDLDDIEVCMGGNRKAPLFDLQDYRERMQVEDASVANSIRMVAVRNSSGSMGSDMSDASNSTTYARSPTPT